MAGTLLECCCTSLPLAALLLCFPLRALSAAVSPVPPLSAERPLDSSTPLALHGLVQGSISLLVFSLPFLSRWTLAVTAVVVLEGRGVIRHLKC